MAVLRVPVLLILVMLAATALSGCHGLEDLVEDPADGAGGASDDPTGGDETEDPADGTSGDTTTNGSRSSEPASDDPGALSLTMAIENAPATMRPDASASLKVKVSGDSGTADTTEVRYGTKSAASKDAADVSTSDYGKTLAGPNDFTVPGTYTVASWTPGSEGDYYMRGHVVIDGIHYWSPEKKVTVDAPAVEEASGTPDHTVTIGTGGSAADFSPATLSVAKGETVAWTNNDATATPHTATSTAGPGSFDTGNLDQGDTSKAFRFNDAGTYDYKCAYHPSMVAKITVA